MKCSRLVVCAAAVLSLAGRADAQILYGATAAGGSGELFILNPANGAVVQDIGPLNDAGSTNYGITGLAFNPITGVLYGSVSNNGPATAARTRNHQPHHRAGHRDRAYNAGPVSGTGRPSTMADLAFDAAGNLFGIGSVGGPVLYSINTATGQATPSVPPGPPAPPAAAWRSARWACFWASPQSTPAAGAEFGTYDQTTGGLHAHCEH